MLRHFNIMNNIFYHLPTQETISLEERMRQNIEDNAKFFTQLGMHAAKQQFDEVSRTAISKPPPSSRGLKPR